MLHLQVFGASQATVEAAERLQALTDARHVIRTVDADSQRGLVTAEIADDAVSRVLKELDRLGLPPEDVVLVRVDSIDPSAAQRPLANVVWADLLGASRATARPFGQYLMFMIAAGIVAAFGVIYANVVLIVGAMAISPDTLPITATATALVLRRWHVVKSAMAALGTGLATVCLVDGVLTFALHRLDLLPKDFAVGKGDFLAGLSTVNISTPIVALAAGMAGILALQTRASSAVGVAISVTTIPASAYLGVAAGLHQGSKAAGALLVLGVNVAMLLAGGCVIFAIQQKLAPNRPFAPNRDFSV